MLACKNFYKSFQDTLRLLKVTRPSCMAEKLSAARIQYCRFDCLDEVAMKLECFYGQLLSHPGERNENPMKLANESPAMHIG